VFDCEAGPNTVVAVDEAGEATLTHEFSARDYVLLLPPGSYEIEAHEGNCFSEAAVTVLAGKGVKANVICNLP